MECSPYPFLRLSTVPYPFDDSTFDDAQTTGSGNVSDNEGDPASPGWERLDGSDPQVFAEAPVAAAAAAPVAAAATATVVAATTNPAVAAAAPAVTAAAPAVAAAAPPIAAAAPVIAARPIVAAAPVIAAAPGVAPAAPPGLAHAAAPGVATGVPMAQCPICQTQQTVPRITPGETVYVVTVGLQVGIFTDWSVPRCSLYLTLSLTQCS